MLDDQRLFLTQLVTLAAVLDPISHLTLFVSSTTALPRNDRRRVAILAILIAFTILTAFGFLGQYVLHAMGVSLMSFQIAGGIIIFLFALSMVLGDPTSDTASVAGSERLLAVAVYPLAVPILAGPGSILTVMVLMDNNRFSAADQVITILALAGVLGVLLGVFAASDTLSRVLGKGGSNVLRRIMGLILAALSVNLVLSAVAAWLRLPAI
ncbi:MAG TPA: MarC family protein [Propionibacteriaceae bacterium]|nr:MarC family protein [Propionibacteriaceae bacterium]